MCSYKFARAAEQRVLSECVDTIRLQPSHSNLVLECGFTQIYLPTTRNNASIATITEYCKCSYVLDLFTVRVYFI